MAGSWEGHRFLCSLGAELLELRKSRDQDRATEKAGDPNPRLSRVPPSAATQKAEMALLLL